MSNHQSAETNSRIESIRSLLKDPPEQTAPNNQARCWRSDCEFLLVEADDRALLLEKALPHLRALAYHCEDCEGSGEIVRGPSDEEAYSEPCKNCKPIWDLIELMKPPAPPPAPVQQEEEDDILF